jgi:hypothetical protein
MLCEKLIIAVVLDDLVNLEAFIFDGKLEEFVCDMKW